MMLNKPTMSCFCYLSCINIHVQSKQKSLQNFSCPAIVGRIFSALFSFKLVKLPRLVFCVILSPLTYKMELVVGVFRQLTYSYNL